MNRPPPSRPTDRAERPAGEVEVRFQRKSPGKVEFIRRSAGLDETLVDHGHDETGPGPKEARSEFVWAGGDGDDYTLTARFRSGWSVHERRWAAQGGTLRPVE